MSEKEHPARTAGRYVRAAGIAIRKERDRLAAESAAKRAAEAAQAEQEAAQAPPQPPPQAPPAAPRAAEPPPAVPAAPKRPSRPAPPPNRLLDRLFWFAFIVTIVAMCLALLNVQMLASGTAEDIVRLVLGVIFLVVASAMLLNVGHMKDRILTTLTLKLWGLGHPTTRMGRFMRGAAKDVLTLLGIGWLTIATYEILTALVR
jgi:hypothetical protein